MAKTMEPLREITIFNTRTPSREVSKDDRNILFENMRAGSGIDSYHFESFGEIEDDMINNRILNSNIPGIAVKTLSNHITLILKKRTSKEFSISVQLPHHVRAVDKVLEPLPLVSKNSRVDCIGIIYDSSLYMTDSLRLKTYIETLPVLTRIANGIIEPYNDNSILQKNTHLALHDKRVIIFFNNKEMTSKSLDLLIKYHKFHRQYYADSLLYMYRAVNLPPLLSPHIKEKKKQFRKGKELTPLMSLINDIYTNNIVGENTRISTLYDILYGKLWDVYQAARLYGIDSEHVSKLLDEEKERQNAERRTHEQFIELIKQKSKHAIQLNIARVLFNKNDIKELTTAENETVLLRYEYMTSLEKAVRDNKCKHIKLLNRVMRSRRSGRSFDTNAWSELKELVPLVDGELNMLPCTICKMLVLCPHHHMYFEAIRGRNVLDNSDDNMRIQLIKRFADKTPINNAHYCKICGERIVRIYPTQQSSYDDRGLFMSDSAAGMIDRKVWGGAMQIIKGHVSFATSTDIKGMASAISQIVTPFVEDIYSTMKLDTSLSDDTVKDSLYIYIRIYVYSSLIRIMSQQRDITFKDRKTRGGGTKSSKPSTGINPKRLKRLFTDGVNIMVSTSDKLINRVPHMSIDSIKSLFIKAYKDVSSLHIHSEHYNSNILPPEHVANSVVYGYVYYINKKTNPELDFYDIKNILGAKLTEVNDLSNIAHNVKTPAIWKSVSSSTPGVSFSRDYLDLYNKYAYVSFIHFIKYIKYGACTSDSGAHREHLLEYEKIKKIEDRLMCMRGKTIISNPIKFKNTHHNDYVHTRPELYHTYCADGRLHEFDIRVYLLGDSYTYIHKKDINKMVKNRESNDKFRKMILIDRKCTLCGNLQSKLRPYKKPVSVIINAANQVSAFYDMYVYRCPSGDIHEWNNVKCVKCVKCGITHDIIRNKDMDFFLKYEKTFDGDKHNRNKQKKKIYTYYRAIPPVEKTYQEWKLTDKSVLELSKKTNNSYNLMMNIGMLEGNSFKIMTSDAPDKSIIERESRNPNRLLRLISHMRTMRIEYEQLRNRKSKAAGINTIMDKWKGVDFGTFPDIYADFSSKFEYYGKILDIPLMSNFVLDAIASSLLSISNHFHGGEDDYKKASTEYVYYAINKILDSETGLSDRGILRGVTISDELDHVPLYDAVEDNDVEISAEFYDPFSLENSAINKDSFVNL